LYEAHGLGNAEISSLVSLTLIEDPAILSMGVSERHASAPVSIKTYPDLFTWALSIGRYREAQILSADPGVLIARALLDRTPAGVHSWFTEAVVIAGAAAMSWYVRG
jgi:hypothetical protein